MKRLFYFVVMLLVITNCKSSDVEVRREKVDFVTLEELSIDSYARIVTYFSNENGVGVRDFGIPNFIVINDDSTYKKSIQRMFDNDDNSLPEIDFTKYTLLFAETIAKERPQMILEKEDERMKFTIKTKRAGENGHDGAGQFSFSAIVPKVEETRVKFEIITIN